MLDIAKPYTRSALRRDCGCVRLQGTFLTWGSLIWFCVLADSKVQEETQDCATLCEVADDSVVVMKSRPMKGSNALEDKSGMTWGMAVGYSECLLTVDFRGCA